MITEHEEPRGSNQQNAGSATQEFIGQEGNMMPEQRISEGRLLLMILVIAVCGAVIGVHWPALSAKAISFDDVLYLTGNPLVQNPSWASARRFLAEALTPSTVDGYYQPLSMISLMTDYALGGRENNLMPFHRTSLLLHAANTALIIVLLYLLFGQVWIAAAVGLLFGVHPMTVEPIPWVGERKTLLSAFFALWCLVLYIGYTRKGNWGLYVSCFVMYVLALLSKPTSTPVPVLLVLLDYWPLRRLRWKAVLEKISFFIVGGVSAIVTYISQSRTAGVILPAKHDSQRVLLELCHNIVFYPYKMVWPVNLSSHYPFPDPFGLSNPMALAGVVGTCILIVLLVISLRWTRGPAAGWLFFFMAILPTMQIIRFSRIIASDKFAYLPSVGLLMMLASFLGWLSRCGKPVIKHGVIIIALILAGAESAATRQYLSRWRDSETLYEYMLSLAPDFALLRINLGIRLKLKGKYDKAISHLRQAIQLDPCSAESHHNLADALQSTGKLDEAIGLYRKAIQLRANYAEAHNNLGVALASQGKFDEAISHYFRALQLKPGNAKTYSNLGNSLLGQGRITEATTCYREAIRLEPNFVEAHHNLANVLESQGRSDEAISHYRQVLKIDPNYGKVSEKLRSLYESTAGIK